VPSTLFASTIAEQQNPGSEMKASPELRAQTVDTNGRNGRLTPAASHDDSHASAGSSNNGAITNPSHVAPVLQPVLVSVSASSSPSITSLQPSTQVLHVQAAHSREPSGHNNHTRSREPSTLVISAASNASTTGSGATASSSVHPMPIGHATGGVGGAVGATSPDSRHESMIYQRDNVHLLSSIDGEPNNRGGGAGAPSDQPSSTDDLSSTQPVLELAGLSY
jgi:hypothetical protein